MGSVAPPHQKSLYCSILLLLEVVATAAGPVIGGAITSRLGWRWCFWINPPAGALAFLILLFPLRLPLSLSWKSREELDDMSFRDKLYQCDLFGGSVIAGSLTCLFLALQWGGERWKWSDIRIIVLLIAFGASFLYALIQQSNKGDAAVLPVRLKKMKHVTAYLFICICFASAQSLALYYVSWRAPHGLKA